ncbi:MAG: N-acetyl-alpha-D-muramate 1-phosphate uridylyltransferase [Hyphomicrobiales bacterium]|jgi:NDP-sugar pyrophosphorylase family protein|nr:N-acetyl-alpha-D-muramate 1-phosphate uridylyltransferase [Hyphomicrobiales bacterium]
MQCVILAGGLGTRIRGRSGDLPKALIPVVDKPFVAYQLEWLKRQGVRDVVLSVGYRGAMIADAIGDGARFGVSVVYSDEGEILRGTGGALRYAADQNLLDEAFFVLYGDSYLPIDFAPVWHTSENGRFCTMTVMRNRGRWDRSNVVVRDGKLVLYDKFASGPAAEGMEFIDYGLSVLRRDVVQDETTAGETCDLAHVLTRLSRAGKLRAHEIFERFYEAGSPEGLDDFEAYIRVAQARAPKE